MSFFVPPQIKCQFTGEDPVCWRGCWGRDANHLLMFPQDPGLKHLWSKVHDRTEGIFNVKIPSHFKILFLGDNHVFEGQGNGNLFRIMISAAKETIARHGAVPQP